MKNLLLFFALTISSSLMSQTKFLCTAVKSGVKVDSTWIMDDVIETDLVFTVDKRKISVNDSSSSVYRLYSDGEDSTGTNFESTVWLAYDEEFRRVIVKSIQYKTGEFLLVIEYSDHIFMYMLNKLLD